MDFSANDLGILLLGLTNFVLVMLNVSLVAWIYLRSPGLSPKNVATPNTESEPLFSADDDLDLADMLNEVGAQSIAPLGEAFNSSMQLVSSIDGLEPAQYPQWRSDHQAQITELMEHRKDLEFQLEDLKTKLDRAHKVMTNLHAQNRKLQKNEGQSTTLHVRVQHLTEEMGRMREQREQASKDAAEAQRDLQESQRELKKQSNQMQAEREELERSNKLLREETQLLRVQLEREREVLSRTLVEKDFIETVFLETDAATDQLRQFKSDYEELQKAHRLLQVQLARNKTV